MKTVPYRIEIPEKHRPIKWGWFLKILTILWMCITPVLVISIINYLVPSQQGRWLSFATLYPKLEMVMVALGVINLSVYTGYVFYVKASNIYFFHHWPFGFFREYSILNTDGQVMMLCFVDDKLQTMFFDNIGLATSHAANNDYKANTIFAFYNLAKNSICFYILKKVTFDKRMLELPTRNKFAKVNFVLDFDLDGHMNRYFSITCDSQKEGNVENFCIDMTDFFDHVEANFSERYTEDIFNPRYDNFSKDFCSIVGWLKPSVLFIALKEKKQQLDNETYQEIVAMIDDCIRFEQSSDCLEARELKVKLWKLLNNVNGAYRITTNQGKQLQELSDLFDDPEKREEFNKPTSRI